LSALSATVPPGEGAQVPLMTRCDAKRPRRRGPLNF